MGERPKINKISLDLRPLVVYSSLSTKYCNETEDIKRYSLEGAGGYGKGVYQSDLFMAPKKSEMWLRVYKSWASIHPLVALFSTEEEARKINSESTIFIQKIEWEE